MHRFWNSIIEPMINILRPNSIVEISFNHEYNTINLLKYCVSNQAILHVIDPLLPKHEISKWQKEYGDHLVFHQLSSLNALPHIDRMDMVFIDGDHNWYTVFNELKLIDKFCKKTQCIFPLIMLPNVGWPYGRRDLYSHPEAIPIGYQKPYKKLGVSINSTELVKNCGLNSHLYNSIYENNIQNGVLTAVEDFLESSNLKLEFIKIPVLFGLGILFPLHLKETNQHFKTFIDQFYLPEAVSKIMEQLETMRLESEIDRQETQAILTKQAATHQEEVTVLRRIIDGQFADLHTKDKTLSQLQERIACAKQQENQLRKKIERLHAELTGHQQKTEKLHDELTGHKQEIERQHTELTGNEKERARLHAELQTHKIELLERDKEIERLRLLQAEQKHRLTAREQDIRQYQLSNQQLRHWLEQLNQHTKALLESWRWKSGNLFIRSIEKTLLRSKVPLAADHMQEILKSFENQANHPAPAQAEILPLKIISKQTQSTSRLSGKSVDIVICVHNALDDVRQCLNSVVRHTPQNTCRIIIVNDGSDIVTSTFLRKFATRHQCILIESPVSERYTKAANKGLKASTADYVVLLNSDTIVPEYWLDRLIECGESDPEIGIIGPLSNAATYQSVPNVREGSDWSLNPLPNGFTVDDMARIVEKVSEKRFPSLPFINGFCYVIKRAVIDKIGYLDQETFPNGYGEENDFSFRTRQAGFRLAIADNTYVYHAKSKSYGHKIRKSLTKNSHQSLFNKHGPDLIKPAIAQQNQSTVLEYIRNRLRDVLSSPEYIHRFQKGENLRVLWLLMDQVERGDDFDSIMHDSEAILGLGIHSEIAIHRSWRDNTLASHPFAPREMFYCYDYESQLLAHAANFDIVVATHSKTVAVLERICKAASGVMPAYFIQDYEPTFLPEDRPDLLHQAKTSYTAIPHMVRFAKTDWIRKIVQQHHNVTVAKVAPSLDTRLYYPWLRKRTAERHAVHIVAMVKPASPLRAPKETMLLLGTIQQRYLDNVDVTIFGNDPTSSDFLALPQDFTFENHGLLSREAVADLINTADIFVDMSKFQSFGRTGLEAMALGCATILPKEGGVHEYAVHEENALIIDTHNMDEAVAALDRLIRDEALRTRLANNGILTASHYAASTAALSEVLLFREALKEWLVTIIVPIFNTYDEIQACIDSLLSYTNHPHRLVLIDDCSSDTRIWPMLQSYAASYYHITALRNTTHLGYAQTINKGCQMAEGDVVLLNSNTEVSPGWLSKLREASRSRNNIATVTALSNSAGAFSIPENNKINPLPAGFTVERMAALVEQYSPKRRPEVPTGNGFCMYVTRKAMQAVGWFDDTNFSNGYGAVNDFAMQAHYRGLTHLIEDATFIYHKENASTQEEKTFLIEQGQRRLCERYADYQPMMTAWLENNPLDSFRVQLKKVINESQQQTTALLPTESNWRPVLLYIVHNENDDILRINLALMRAVSSQYICYMLQTDLKDWNLYDWRNNQLHLIKNYSFADAWSIDKPLGKNRWDALEQIYKICRPSIVHFHHLIANHPDMIEYFKDRGHPVVMSFHDFYTICPTIQLMDNTGKYCAGYCNTLQGDCQCTPRWFTRMPHLKDRYVHAWHDKVGPSLSLCDAFIVPSPSTRDIIRDHYPYLEKSKFRIIEHGHNHGKTFSLSSEAPSICSPIKVVLFGQLDEYRGLRFIEGMLQHNQNSGNPVELHILGTASLKLDHKQSGLICYGSYTREELPEKLAQIRPTLALLPSFWPETFGYDLFEVWTAGIPVLGSSLGATGDLLRRHGGGWTLYPDDPQQWFEKILEIANSPEDYQDRIKEVRSLHLRNTEEMAQDYVRVYQRLLVPVSNKPETDMEPIQTMIN